MTGVPVSIDNELSIYVQEPHHHDRVHEMSYKLSKLNKKMPEDAKKPKWRRGDSCVAKLNDATFYRAQIKTVFWKDRRCKVMSFNQYSLCLQFNCVLLFFNLILFCYRFIWWISAKR